MFRLLSAPSTPLIELTINNQSVSVPEGISVWAAMALAGDTTTRIAPVTEQKRSAYCAMGVCFECLVEIDQQPNQQACLTPVKAGMQIKRQVITETTSAPIPTQKGVSHGKL